MIARTLRRIADVFGPEPLVVPPLTEETFAEALDDARQEAFRETADHARALARDAESKAEREESALTSWALMRTLTAVSLRGRARALRVVEKWAESRAKRRG